MIKNILIIGLTFFKFYTGAQVLNSTFGFPEVTTSTGQSDPSNTPTVSGMQFRSFQAYGTSLNPNASARFSFTGWPVGASNGDDDPANFIAVLSPTIYYEVRCVVNAGYTLNLTSLHFDVRRSGTGIRNYCLRSGRDQFTNNLAAGTGTNSQLFVLPNDVFFWKYDSLSTNNDQKGSSIYFDTTFSHITDSVVFRFYAWNSESNGGSFSLDNVNFIGTLTSTANLNALSSDRSGLDTKELLKIVPQPIIHHCLELECKKSFVQIDILDLEQKTLLVKRYTNAISNCVIDLESFPSGMYILQVHLKEGLIRRSFVMHNTE